MGYGWDVLASQNVSRVVPALQDQQTLAQPLLFLDRTAKVTATDDEITARDKSYVFAADIISNDAKALIRDAGEFTFQQTRIAKIKHGLGLNESQLQLLYRIERNAALPSEYRSFAGYVARSMNGLLLGVRQRMECMIIGMLLDGYNYNRLGIQMGGSWGTPATLKVTPTTLWSSTSSTPITDLMSLKYYAQYTWGEMYNRVTMSTKTLQYILATTEFIEKYKATAFVWAVNSLAVTTADPTQWVAVVGKMIGMTVEIYDGRYREHQNDGSIAAPIRFFPEEKVLLTNSADDNGMGYDWANGLITESIVGAMGGTSVIGGMQGGTFGPIGYTTQADPALNPPGIVLWATTRGAPRRHRETCAAVINAWTP